MVGDDEDQLGTFGLHGQRHTLAIVVPQRVAHQVAQHLLYQRPVQHDLFRQFGGKLQLQGHALVPGLHVLGAYQIRQHLAQRHGCGPGLRSLVAKAREAQHVLQCGVEGAGRQPEQVQQGLGFCQAGITQQFGCAQNAVQWTANLVAHGGQEHRHGVLGLPGTLDGPLVAGDIVHQDDEAAVQLGGAVLQGAKADVEAASSRVRIQPDGVQFLPTCGQDVVDHGLQRVAVVLQRQPVA